MYFMVFRNVKAQNVFLLVDEIKKICFGMPYILDIYNWVKSRCCGQAFASRKLVSTSILAHRRRGRWTVFF